VVSSDEHLLIYAEAAEAAVLTPGEFWGPYRPCGGAEA
jgi:hypothetical protein